MRLITSQTIYQRNEGAWKSLHEIAEAFLRKLKTAACWSKKHKHSDYTVLASDFTVRSVTLKKVEKGSYVTRVEGKNYCMIREQCVRSRLGKTRS